MGFDILEGEHPIVPVMIYDSLIAKAVDLLDLGIYVIAFNYPVVPKRSGTKNYRAMEKEHLDKHTV